MKLMFIVYHDLETEERSKEILKCAIKLGETTLVSYSRTDDFDDYKFIITGKGKKKYFYFLLKSIRAIRREKPDIIILHDNYTSPILRWLQKHKKNIYIIYDSSELYIEKYKIKNFKNLISEIFKYFEKKYLKYANLVIAANKERAEIMFKYFDLKSLPLVFDNIHKIDLNIDNEFCDMKYKKYFENKKFNIVYGGGVSKNRCTYELAKSFLELGENYNLVIVGFSTEKEKSNFNLFLEKNNIKNVFYLGFVSRMEWKYLISCSHATVVAFSQNTVNNINCASGKMYESLFELKPIIATENPPLKRICKEKNVGVSSNNFKESIKILEKNYKFYIENIKLFLDEIDYDKRIDKFSDKLIKIIGEQLNL